MKTAAAILTQWRHQDPDRLLQTALRQAQQLAEMSPELERLSAENAWLSQQLEATTKRIVELEEALETAQRAAYRQAAPFRIPEQKRVPAPKRPGRKRGIQESSVTNPIRSMSTRRSNSVFVRTAGVDTSLINRRSNRQSKTFPRCALV